MAKPACSIIIPTYDCLAYLPAALSTVRAQNRDDLEILVVDDASTDGTDKWLAEQAAEDRRLRVLCGPGRGPAEARNLALTEARAPLVAFLDADDVWKPEKLNAQLAFHASRPDVVFSFTDYLHVDPQGAGLGTCFDYWPCFRRDSRAACGYRPLQEPSSALFAENVVGTSTVVARLSALQDANGFATDLASAEDWDLWLRLSLLGPIGFTDAVDTIYLMRPGSVSGDATARLAAIADIMRRHAEVAAPAPWALRRAQARLLTGQAEHARRQGARRKALAAHALALLHAPSLRALRATVSDAAGLVFSNR